jgi:cyclomaltodextrinase / maltogenic alpha-amylase / neopullulanase
MRIAPLFLVVACTSGCAQALAPAPSPVAAEGEVVFAYRPPPGAPELRSLSVRGTFNDWSESALPMERQADGSWRASTELEAGRHEYKYYINGAWPADMCDDRTWGDPRAGYRIDPDAHTCVPDGNTGRNAVRNLADTATGDGLGYRHDPAGAAYVSVADGRLSVRIRVNRERLTSARVVADGHELPMHRQLGYSAYETWRAVLPPDVSSYRVVLETADGTSGYGPYTPPAAPFRALDWVGAAVGYQIFPERFENGDTVNDRLALESDAHRFMHPDFAGTPPVLTRRWDGEVHPSHCCHQYFGGDLQGVVRRLDHLERLGVTLLYLNPVFLAGSAHGYDTFDYLRVAPHLGGEAALRRLLDEAHARGMRVIWDFVPNHVGVGHAAFRDAVARGEESPFHAWFRFRVPAAQVQVGNGAHYDAWGGFGSLPKLDTRVPAVTAHLMDVVRHWTDFGFDGIRVDVPNEILNRKEFFREFRRVARSANPESYLVGEIWQRSPGWVQGDEFDALMNYAIGQEVIERFATGAITAGAAAETMARLYAEYPEAAAAMLFNVIATHDTGRLLTKMGGGPLDGSADAAARSRHRLASAMLFALPGVPVTFQGDECAFLGTGGRAPEENRYPMQWQACDAPMTEHYRHLAALKRALPALRSAVIRIGRAGDDAVLAFHRGEPGAGELLAIFNGAPEARVVPLPAGLWRDAASGEEPGGSLPLPPFGWRYLVRR